MIPFLNCSEHLHRPTKMAIHVTVLHNLTLDPMAMGNFLNNLIFETVEQNGNKHLWNGPYQSCIQHLHQPTNQDSQQCLTCLTQFIIGPLWEIHLKIPLSEFVVPMGTKFSGMVFKWFNSKIILNHQRQAVMLLNLDLHGTM